MQIHFFQSTEGQRRVLPEARLCQISFRHSDLLTRNLMPNRRSFAEAIQIVLHDLGMSNYEPPRQKFNGAQRIAYTAVILMGTGSLLTGLAIYKPTQLHVITALLGGYEMARWFHFWLTIAYVGFFLMHVAQVVAINR